MAKKQTKKAEAEAEAKVNTKLHADQFAIWLTLPKSARTAVREASGKVDLAMSEFARRAVLEAVSRSQRGEQPFSGGNS